MTGKGPVDPADLPDTPWRAPALVSPGLAVAPLEVPSRAPVGGGLAVDGNLEAALHDDHTEDTPPTAIPGHFGISAEELLAQMMDDDDEDAEETALRRPIGAVTATVPFKPEDDAPAEAPRAPTPEVAPAPVAAPAPTIPVVPAPQPTNAGTVQMPMWALAGLLLLIGALAGTVLTLFIAKL